VIDARFANSALSSYVSFESSAFTACCWLLSHPHSSVGRSTYICTYIHIHVCNLVCPVHETLLCAVAEIHTSHAHIHNLVAFSKRDTAKDDDDNSQEEDGRRFTLALLFGGPAFTDGHGSCAGAARCFVDIQLCNHFTVGSAPTLQVAGYSQKFMMSPQQRFY
jgi:hypothetical protein